MTLLAIETAAELVGVAIADGDGPRAGVWVRSGRRHAESLAPAIAHVIEQTGTSLAEVETVAVDVGPGLYTGLRVG
ncbi:MAG: tRNA (adenosine(37)-N6)-threonylcarbamoyltransferase complex dimerization subunit type 1 TsaB, partial [Acidimicrobiales bacterium]